jgi:hypothetical protein
MKTVMKAFARTVAAILPSCKEATRLQSAALDRRLTLLERFSLRCHLVICKWCRRYGRQIQYLCSAAREHAQHDPLAPAQGLPPEARERIKRTLQAAKD